MKAATNRDVTACRSTCTSIPTTMAIDDITRRRERNHPLRHNHRRQPATTSSTNYRPDISTSTSRPPTLPHSAALDGFISSTGRFDPENVDVNDNGMDSPTSSPTASAAWTSSQPWRRTADTHVRHETDINNSGTYGPNNVGNHGQTDADSNLTMDFGFVQPPRSSATASGTTTTTTAYSTAGNCPFRRTRQPVQRRQQ